MLAFDVKSRLVVRKTFWNNNWHTSLYYYGGIEIPEIQRN